MNKPTHDQVAQRAQKIWRDSGCPVGRDPEIWLEAERQLCGVAAAREAPDALADRIKAETVVESEIEYLISPAIADDAAVEAAMENRGPQAARSPGSPGAAKTTPPAGRAPERR